MDENKRIDPEEIKKKLSSEDAAQRAEAIDLLRTVEKGSELARLILPSLVRLLASEKDLLIISRLTKLIGQLGDESHIEYLVPFLWSNDKRVVANTIEGMEALSSPHVVQHIKPFLNSDDNRIKANAAKALWKLDRELAFRNFQEMVNSSEFFFRESASHVLSHIKDPLASDLLLELLKRETDSEIVRQTIAGIVASPSNEILRKIDQALQTAEDHQIKENLEYTRKLLQNLLEQKKNESGLAEKEERQYLIELLKSGSNSEKELAARRLADIGDKETLEIMKTFLNIDSMSTRYIIRKSMGQLIERLSSEIYRTESEEKQDRECLKHALGIDISAPPPPDEIDIVFLILDLSDSNPKKRMDAVSRLLAARRTTPEAREAFKYLQEHLKCERNPAVISQCLKVIGWLGNNDAIDFLASYLKNATDYRIIANIIEGLGYADSPSVTSIVEPYLAHPDNRVRANAMKAIWKHDPNRASRQLIEMLHSPEIPMRDSAAYLLTTIKPLSDELLDAVFDAFLKETSPDIIEKLVLGLVEHGGERILRAFEAMRKSCSKLKEPYIDFAIESLESKLMSESTSLTASGSHSSFAGNFSPPSPTLSSSSHKDTESPSSINTPSPETYIPGTESISPGRKVTSPESPDILSGQAVSSEQTSSPGKTESDFVLSPHASLNTPDAVETMQTTTTSSRNPQNPPRKPPPDLSKEPVETVLKKMNHTDELVRSAAVTRLEQLLREGLPKTYFEQAEMLLQLALNDSSLIVRKQAFDVYNLIQTRQVKYLKEKNK